MIAKIARLAGHGAVCLLVVLLSCMLLHGAGKDDSVEHDVSHAHHLIADLCHNPPILSVEMVRLSHRLTNSQAASPFSAPLAGIQTGWERGIETGLNRNVVSPEALRLLYAVYRVYLI